jgi:hypothetical protein
LNPSDEFKLRGHSVKLLYVSWHRETGNAMVPGGGSGVIWGVQIKRPDVKDARPVNLVPELTANGTLAPSAQLDESSLSQGLKYTTAFKNFQGRLPKS